MLWERASPETVPCMWQDMWRMWEDQPLLGSVQVTAESADEADMTTKCQVNS